MSVLIDGISLRFYRGIGPDIQFIGPFSKMNLFIGPNNAGKSIVLNAIAKHIKTSINEGKQKILDPVEQYKGEKSGVFKIALGIDPRQVERDILGYFSAQGKNQTPLTIQYTSEIIKKISHQGLIWLTVNSKGGKEIYPPVNLNEAEDWIADWQHYWNALTDRRSGSLKQHWVPESFNMIPSLINVSIPSVELIPAKRQLGESGESFEDLSGKGLIDRLANLQNPSWDKREDSKRFLRINEFLREITGKPDALLEIPSDREHVLVHMDNKVLPLSSLGTGIHEVILIASFCTIHDNSLMCIEEPEIHLHPQLQRKLLRYLAENTNSQYFIATHSSAFIDTPDCSIFHVTNNGAQSYIKSAVTRTDQRGILDDLGCNASDILQANAIVWVEGPSDRIYVRHWLSHFDSRLLEGVHYTIMFYGGSLIRHISTSDEALDEFIKLRELNRNFVIILDSDKESEDAPLKGHAKRILDEMSDGNGIVWVSAGREIENYVDGYRLQSAMKTIHSRIYNKPCATGKYDYAWHFFRESNKSPKRSEKFKHGDKVGAASLISKHPANLKVLDLEDRISELARMIQRANGLDAI